METRPSVGKGGDVFGFGVRRFITAFRFAFQEKQSGDKSPHSKADAAEAGASCMIRPKSTRPVPAYVGNEETGENYARPRSTSATSAEWGIVAADW
jgi:hypothetical protein